MFAFIANFEMGDKSCRNWRSPILKWAIKVVEIGDDKHNVPYGPP